MKPSAETIALGFTFYTRTLGLARVWLTAGAQQNPVPSLMWGAASGSPFSMPQYAASLWNPHSGSFRSDHLGGFFLRQSSGEIRCAV